MKMDTAKWMLAAAAVSVAATGLEASAYKLPEQSVRSMALSAAYVAGTVGADTSYFNPANMGWLEEEQ
jgi:long-chain fatty acid transport protein